MARLHGRLRERGLSIVEFLVGVTVGLFIVGGAAKLFADYMVSNKRLMLDTRVNQEVRAAADFVARDVRRAGYWNDSLTGVWGTGSSTIAPNPHATASGVMSSTATSVTYTYARAASGNTAGLDSNEYAGFRLANVNSVPTLQFLDGQNNWQSITDPGTVRITAFSVTPVTPALVNDLSKYCNCLSTLKCTLAQISDPTFNPAGAPTLAIPSFQITLTGQSITDSSVVRSISEAVRVRNPVLTGSCPAA
ncbi:MAG TPA: hypothetical protein VFQ16_02065 [Burkholderiaceae bacterium]|nr:hypothetical protein [Burkholderiaceae bacterium]